MSRTDAWVLGAVLLVALAALPGCGRIAGHATRGAAEKATGVKVDEKTNQVTVTGKDGKTVTFSGGDKKLPPDLPKDFPVYTGTAEGGSSATSAEGSTYAFTVVTGDPVKTVLAWYGKELAGNGWSIESSAATTVNGADSANITAKKGPSDATVMINADPSKNGQVTIGAIVNRKE